jgi:hypothetical protein
MRPNNTSKIFIGTYEVAGFYKNLTKGFHDLGYDCDFLTYQSNPFNYGGETNNNILVGTIKYLNFINTKIKLSFLIFFNNTIILFLQICLFLYSLMIYDVFIFGYGKTFIFKNLDLPVLHFFNKKIISILSHGSEARPPYINGVVLSPQNKFLSNSYLVNSTIRKKKLVNYHFKYADIIVGAPYTNHAFSPSRFINSLSLGIPYHFDGKPKIKVETKKSVRILHSPSNPIPKGSEIIKSVVNKLILKGYRIDFILIRNQPTSVVFDEIQKCDFVVDQVYSDTPMSGFATEAAWFAKPSIVGGYKLFELKKLVPQSMWPPSKLCHPDNLEQAIEDLIANKVERLDLGKRAQAYVSEEWTASKVASRYLKLINNDIPIGWWVDPTLISYIHGAGISEKKLKKSVSKIISEFGLNALELYDRPDLEKAFLELLKSESIK